MWAYAAQKSKRSSACTKARAIKGCIRLAKRCHWHDGKTHNLCIPCSCASWRGHNAALRNNKSVVLPIARRSRYDQSVANGAREDFEARCSGGTRGREAAGRCAGRGRAIAIQSASSNDAAYCSCARSSTGTASNMSGEVSTADSIGHAAEARSTEIGA